MSMLTLPWAPKASDNAAFNSHVYVLFAVSIDNVKSVEKMHTHRALGR